MLPVSSGMRINKAFTFREDGTVIVFTYENPNLKKRSVNSSGISGFTVTLQYQNSNIGKLKEVCKS